MTSLYLVRHGETDWNRAKRIQGSTDIPLNDTGRAQARTTGALLATRPWDRIVSSPLSRALETAQIIADTVGIGDPEPLDSIVERHYGEAEGLDHGQLSARFPGDTPVPGRETREAVAERVVPALVTLAELHPGEAILIVSHGGVIRALLTAVDPDGGHGSIRNGSVHSFRHADGTLELIAFDDPINRESLAAAEEELEDQNAIENRERAGAR